MRNAHRIPKELSTAPGTDRVLAREANAALKDTGNYSHATASSTGVDLYFDDALTVEDVRNVKDAGLMIVDVWQVSKDCKPAVVVEVVRA